MRDYPTKLSVKQNLRKQTYKVVLNPYYILLQESVSSEPAQQPEPQQPQPEATEDGNPSSGSNGSKAETEASEVVETELDSNKTNGEATHSSLDPAGDPTKPDLLGDIEEKQPQDDLEKGIVDMNISEQAKDDEQIMNA